MDDIPMISLCVVSTTKVSYSISTSVHLGTFLTAYHLRPSQDIQYRMVKGVCDYSSVRIVRSFD